MAEENDHIDNSDESLNETLKLIGEMDADELVAQAFNNSYDMITGSSNIEDIIINDNKNGNVITMLAHDIDEDPTNEDLESMIKYFESTEEYEKCAVLQKLIKE